MGGFYDLPLMFTPLAVTDLPELNVCNKLTQLTAQIIKNRIGPNRKKNFILPFAPYHAYKFYMSF